LELDIVNGAAIYVFHISNWFKLSSKIDMFYKKIWICRGKLFHQISQVSKGQSSHPNFHLERNIRLLILLLLPGVSWIPLLPQKCVENGSIAPNAETGNQRNQKRIKNKPITKRHFQDGISLCNISMNLQIESFCLEMIQSLSKYEDNLNQ